MKEAIKRGLSEAEVLRSREKHGKNVLPEEKKKTFIGRFLSNLSDPIIKVLIAAMGAEVLVTLGRCNWFEVGGILLAILIATIVSTVSEMGSERAFLKMQQAEGGQSADVLRGGAWHTLPVTELVVGDTVLLSAGNTVPADGVLLEGSVSVDQSALNGESAEVQKRPGNPGAEWSLTDPALLYRGTVVTAGGGVLRVGRVGQTTFYGTVAKDVQTETRESPLKRRLSALAKVISRIGYVLAGVVGFTNLFGRLVVDNGFSGEKILSTVKDLPAFLGMLIHALTLMITVVVVAVPEGLPMMITVVLSANMKKMSAAGLLVKKPVGIETAGSLNLLFTDKTGTVTSGKITCERIVTASGSYKSPAALESAEPKTYRTLSLDAVFNTECERAGDTVRGGNATDRAIFTAFAHPASGVRVLSKIPFSSVNKYSSVTLATPAKITLMKGAPERILPACRFALDGDGQTVPLDVSRIRDAFSEAASHGERVIAVSARAEEGAAVFVALIVLKDKIRSDAKKAVSRIQNAGIRVVMLTGDSPETAAAIAKEAGILTDGRGIVLTASELAAMSDGEVIERLPHIAVVARALPRDKVRLVKLSQAAGLVVGMTGDGINDAPALRLSDVGFAMGSGCDVAKGAGDIVILDNSLRAIADTVLYGRTVFHSIRKFITFQLMMNLAACGTSLFGQFIGIESPITIMQMLWINIIMDTLGGLAFAGEPALESYMKEPPKARDEPILTKDILRSVALTGGFTLALSVLFLYFGRNAAAFAGDSAQFLTAFYALFVFSGLFNCFNARTERLRLFSDLGKNRPFLLILSLVALVQILMIYFGGELFRCTPLTLRALVMTVGIAALVLPFDTLRRVFRKLRK